MQLSETVVLQYNIPAYCIPCIKTYDLAWSEAFGAQQEALSGEWKGHEMGSESECPPGRIYLTRQQAEVFPFDTSATKATPVPPELSNREKEVVQRFIIDTSSIRIDLYDNAEIDDDTVTVFLNNELLLQKKRLTDRPLTVFVTAEPHKDYELVMYAENLGTIPPNTALMIITTAHKRYEIRLSSSEQKNAAVQFRYEP